MTYIVLQSYLDSGTGKTAYLSQTDDRTGRPVPCEYPTEDEALEQARRLAKERKSRFVVLKAVKAVDVATTVEEIAQ